MTSQTLGSYQSLLRDHAVVSKSITAAVVALLGDFLAQKFEQRGAKHKSNFDWNRAFSVSAEGLCVSGPMLHYAYDTFEALFPSMESTDEGSTTMRYLMTLLQVILDILVLDTIFTGTFMITTAILEGRTRQIPREFCTDFLPSARAAWLSSFMMSPLQFANFGSCP